MFEEKKTTKMYNVYWYRSYTQTFLSCFFIFTNFNTTSLTLLVKIILIRNSKSVKGDYIPFYNLSTEPAFTCSKSPMKAPNECMKSVESNKDTRLRRSDVLIVNFKHIPHLALVVLVFLLLNLNR